MSTKILTVPAYYEDTEREKPSGIRVLATILILVLLLVMSVQILQLGPIHAANDAYQDIINDPRFEGDIKSISWVVRIFDKAMVWVISLVAFFIISAALLKNVFTGLYVTFPKLFDRLSANKYAWKEGKNDGRGGIFLWILSYIIPDVKSFTDFEDGEIGNVRGYVTKSFIIGVITIIIGVSIYNGLYRSLLAQGAGIGTHIIENYILKVDFITGFDKLVETGRMYEFKWKDSTAPSDKQRLKVAEAVYTEVLRAYPDTRSAQARAQLGAFLENKIGNWYADEAKDGRTLNSFFGDENQTFSFSVQWTQADIKPAFHETTEEGVTEFTTAWTMNELGMENELPTEYGPTYVGVLVRFTKNNLSTAGKEGLGSTVSFNVVSQMSKITSTTKKNIQSYRVNPVPQGSERVKISGISYFRSDKVEGMIIGITSEASGNGLIISGYYTADTDMATGEISNIKEATAMDHTALAGSAFQVTTVKGGSASVPKYQDYSVATITFSASGGNSTISTTNGGTVNYGQKITEENDPTPVE